MRTQIEKTRQNQTISFSSFENFVMINNKQRRKEAKEMKTELFLREKDDRSLLVVVDMINGFIHTGALADPKIDHHPRRSGDRERLFKA
ncbi:MAG: hypothetical protein ACLSFJ_05615 [Holdemania filiformis]